MLHIIEVHSQTGFWLLVGAYLLLILWGVFLLWWFLNKHFISKSLEMFLIWTFLCTRVKD